MKFEQDFATVDLILNTQLETRGVDSFILSFIKCEKQARRIFTYLIFQCPTYSTADYSSLRTTLSNNKRMYFGNFIKGLDLILPRAVSDVYGPDYNADLGQLLLFANDRNKIFHGQITSGGLTRADLTDRVTQIKKWCKNLGEKMITEVGFDGFSDSYVKSPNAIALKNTNQFDTIVKYEQFLKTI